MTSYTEKQLNKYEYIAKKQFDCLCVKRKKTREKKKEEEEWAGPKIKDVLAQKSLGIILDF